MQMCFFFTTILLLYGCHKEKPPIKIGFSFNQTNPSIAAIGCRNGVLMAVDNINEAGGISGHKIELIVKDDRFDPDTAVKVDRELIREGVAAIIGHIHSAMTTAALPILVQTKTVMISPMSPASNLTGLDDYLFRVTPPPKITSFKLATYAYQTGLRKILGIYDTAENDYAEPKYLQFKNAFEGLGGQMLPPQIFSSTSGGSIPELTKKMAYGASDGYLIIADPLISALICQHLRKVDAVTPILSSPWAYDQDFIVNGGTAAEGVVLTQAFNKNSRAPTFLKFREDYVRRFSSEPGMWEFYGYEAVMVLAQALSQNPDPAQLKETLLKIRRFKGIQGDIVFDRYGDNRHDPLLFTVKNGAFVEIHPQKNDQH